MPINQEVIDFSFECWELSPKDLPGSIWPANEAKPIVTQEFIPVYSITININKNERKLD